MLEPRHIADDEARRLDAVPGWWGIDDDDKLVLGPYPSREAILVAINDRGLDRQPRTDPPRRSA